MTQTIRQSEAQRIARTMLDQIRAGDKWCLGACGARQYVCFGPGEGHKPQRGDRGGVWFRVTITAASTHHKIVITLTSADLYRVDRIKIKRGSREVITEESHDDIDCESLASVVYSCCNK